VSVYEYQEKRFSKCARALISSIWLVSQTMSPVAILSATSIALIYTVIGSTTAVIWTDVIQSLILFVGTGIIFCMLVQKGNVSIVDSLAPLKE
jgi:SSS family solute:Na+ symporter